jgi:hypothetical protein
MKHLPLRRWAPLGMLAAGVALGLAAPALASPAAASPARTGAASPAAARELGAGQAGPRSAVPWRLVGPGWALADYEVVRDGYPGRETLYLVDPLGGRYTLARWGPYSLLQLGPIAWSGDGRRALFQIFGTVANWAGQLDLRTADVNDLQGFGLPVGQASVVGYTQPAGAEIVIDVGPLAGGVYQIRLYGPLGRVRRVLASFHSAPPALAYQPDGATVALGGPRRLELLSPAGRLIRRLPIPAAAGEGCEPVRWWSARVVLAACVGHRHRFMLWLVPVAGGRPVALTPAGWHRAALDAWRLASGLYVQADNCAIVRLGADGRAAVVRVPGSRGGALVWEATRSRLLLQRDACGQRANSLAWLDPATGAITVAVPAHGESGVRDGVPFYSSGQY